MQAIRLWLQLRSSMLQRRSRLLRFSRVRKSRSQAFQIFDLPTRQALGLAIGLLVNGPVSIEGITGRTEVAKVAVVMVATSLRSTILPIKRFRALFSKLAMFFYRGRICALEVRSL